MSEHDPIIGEPIPVPTAGEALIPEIEPGPQPPTPETTPPSIDPVRAAAGRLGGRRVHELVKLGLEYEREHGLKAGRQRQKQLIQLGRRYEQEHGLAASKPRRRRKGDAWTEFLAALTRVIKPAHRAALDQLIRNVQPPRATAG